MQSIPQRESHVLAEKRKRLAELKLRKEILELQQKIELSKHHQSNTGSSTNSKANIYTVPPTLPTITKNVANTKVVHTTVTAPASVTQKHSPPSTKLSQWSQAPSRNGVRRVTPTLTTATTTTTNININNSLATRSKSQIMTKAASETCSIRGPAEPTFEQTIIMPLKGDLVTLQTEFRMFRERTQTSVRSIREELRTIQQQLENVLQMQQRQSFNRSGDGAAAMQWQDMHQQVLSSVKEQVEIAHEQTQNEIQRVHFDMQVQVESILDERLEKEQIQSQSLEPGWYETLEKRFQSFQTEQVETRFVQMQQQFQDKHELIGNALAEQKRLHAKERSILGKEMEHIIQQKLQDYALKAETNERKCNALEEKIKADQSGQKTEFENILREHTMQWQAALCQQAASFHSQLAEVRQQHHTELQQLQKIWEQGHQQRCMEHQHLKQKHHPCLAMKPLDFNSRQETKTTTLHNRGKMNTHLTKEQAHSTTPTSSLPILSCNILSETKAMSGYKKHEIRSDYSLPHAKSSHGIPVLKTTTDTNVVEDVHQEQTETNGPIEILSSQTSTVVVDERVEEETTVYSDRSQYFTLSDPSTPVINHNNPSTMIQAEVTSHMTRDESSGSSSSCSDSFEPRCGLLTVTTPAELAKEYEWALNPDLTYLESSDDEDEDEDVEHRHDDDLYDTKTRVSSCNDEESAAESNVTECDNIHAVDGESKGFSEFKPTERGVEDNVLSDMGNIPTQYNLPTENQLFNESHAIPIDNKLDHNEVDECRNPDDIIEYIEEVEEEYEEMVEYYEEEVTENSELEGEIMIVDACNIEEGTTPAAIKNSSILEAVDDSSIVAGLHSRADTMSNSERDTHDQTVKAEAMVCDKSVMQTSVDASTDADLNEAEASSSENFQKVHISDDEALTADNSIERTVIDTTVHTIMNGTNTETEYDRSVDDTELILDENIMLNLEAPTSEKVYIVAGPEFGEENLPTSFLGITSTEISVIDDSDEEKKEEIGTDEDDSDTEEQDDDESSNEDDETTLVAAEKLKMDDPAEIELRRRALAILGIGAEDTQTRNGKIAAKVLVHEDVNNGDSSTEASAEKDCPSDDESDSDSSSNDDDDVDDDDSENEDDDSDHDKIAPIATRSVLRASSFDKPGIDWSSRCGRQEEINVSFSDNVETYYCVPDWNAEQKTKLFYTKEEIKTFKQEENEKKIRKAMKEKSKLITALDSLPSFWG